MVDPSFDPSSGHATGIPRGPVYPLIKNIPIKELKTCRRRRRRSLDRDSFPSSIPFSSIPRFRYRSIDRGDIHVQIARNESNPRISILRPPLRVSTGFVPRTNKDYFIRVFFACAAHKGTGAKGGQGR